MASSSWTVRDVAQQLVEERHALIRDKQGAGSDPRVSSAWDALGVLHRVRRDKSPTVCLAFDIAAGVVLKALEMKHGEEDIGRVQDEDLPNVLRAHSRMEEARVTALDRSHHNKDYMKRKESDTVRPPTTTSAPKATEGPKFTRNTPASSAAALDFRFNSSRAILCAAGNLTFEALTPPVIGHDIDVAAVPQNKGQVNMGAVVVEAQTLGQRTIAVVENARRRQEARYRYRIDNARADRDEDEKDFLQLRNPYAWKDESSSDEETEADDTFVPHQPKPEAITEIWKTHCLPRLLNVLGCGAGHAIYHDVGWATRHGRIADLMRALSHDGNYGPHLIVTVEPEVHPFAQEFHDVNGHLTLVNTNAGKNLQVLPYQGSKRRRRKLREYFSQAKGLPESPFHVMVTSYADFLEDYLHFCQIPFEVVVLDDGASWMGAAQGDPNSAIGSIWENGIWSANDQQIGLAGTSVDQWDFSCDEMTEDIVKDAWVGLTARHRLMTSSTLTNEQRQSADLVPVSGLLSFVAPHFADVVREEWDRSRITSDSKSMTHFRQLVARATVVHHPGYGSNDLYQLAVEALSGKVDSQHRADPYVPERVLDDAFVSDGKINFSRRSALAWLGPPGTSWLRFELGKAKLQNILDAMKVSNKHGHFCEEITTASSTTSSGATGQVAGTMAYRLAIRCGRHFGSEQGLRQHVSALHAPPGTWLCRTCGSDCLTSQARTHHERSCGQPSSSVTVNDQNTSVGATPTVGQGGSGKSGVGKKKATRPTGTPQASAAEEKDADGSFRVPGYRGVWVNKTGKHFVKIDGEGLVEEGKNSLLLFDNIDDAAKKYDAVVTGQKKGKKVELNFKPDGSRVVYEDVSTASTSGLGGSAASVVPALSIINIKDLPPDVKPLLRDPRQTSRTGGNSKRHVYAYRGVCRQARKGHDRWQSQISFMGVNHYLGTFDSEWDAAAIYAWAHLILYGEEATKQAQKEGEEAAAAYEQEKKDIAAGKIPEPSPKQKKKKPPPKKPDKPDGAAADGKIGAENTVGKAAEGTTKKRKSVKDGSTTEKKAKTNTKACKLEKEAIGSTVAKGVTKAQVLAPRDAYEGMSDSDLIDITASKIQAARDRAYSVSEGADGISTVDSLFRPCIQVASSLATIPVGSALLVGLRSSWFGWDLPGFVESHASTLDHMTAVQMLAVEYDEDGVNEKFKSVMQGSVAVLGRASEPMQRGYKALALGPVPLGGSVGSIDCHIGGVPGSCGEHAACIRYAPSAGGSTFVLSCLSDAEAVSLNGERVSAASGNVPLYSEDICSVGSRVFAFISPPTATSS